MVVIPAVDIKDNRCVRLKGGKFDRVSDYLSPIEGAKRWSSMGASIIHVVDLDGALGNRDKNKESIKEILQSINTPIQIGGGIRTRGDIVEMLELGARRVVLGSLALTDYEYTKALIKEFKDSIVVAVDGIDGKVAFDAWQQKSEVGVIDLLARLIDSGLKRAIVTDISKDGMLEGPNTELYSKLSTLDIGLIASGGVASLIDIQNLKASGVEGVIIGKALYKGLFTLEEAMNC